MSFLSVIKSNAGGAEVCIYRSIDTVRLCSLKNAKEYVNELRLKYINLWKGKKVVIILWEDENSRMADLWVFGENESDNAGPSVSVYQFRELERYESPVVTAADGLIALGEEAKSL